MNRKKNEWLSARVPLERLGLGPKSAGRKLAGTSDCVGRNKPLGEPSQGPADTGVHTSGWGAGL
jgi:hypothetical protein